MLDRFSATFLEMNTSPYEVSREDFLFTSFEYERLSEIVRRDVEEREETLISCYSSILNIDSMIFQS